MQRTRRNTMSGFSLVELIVAMAVGLIIMAGVVAFFRQGVDLNYRVIQRAEMQQNARVALNLISRDISIAGTGVPAGGIQLPSGAGSQDALFACDQAACYLTANVYQDDRLYAITPADGVGPVINGVATDVVTLVYEDSTLNLGQFPLVNTAADGTQLEVNPLTNPPIDDPAVGITAGDMLALCNANGCAAGVVTGVPSSLFINFANTDPLNFNQTAAAIGNIASILDGPGIPPTRASRIVTITYYIEIPPGPDGVAGTGDDGAPRLMQQINAHPPVPVAENIEDLQISYDLFDDNLAVATTDQPNAGGTPNQIRKINVSVTFRSPNSGLFQPGFEHLTLTTSISARNLSFRDRYE